MYLSEHDRLIRKYFARSVIISRTGPELAWDFSTNYAGLDLGIRVAHCIDPRALRLDQGGILEMKTVKTTILAGLLGAALLAPASSAIAKDDHHFHVPPGHMPPPGMCRIWFPGRPPGHQPAPGSCRVLSRQVPAGAYLLANDDHRWSHDELHDRRFRYEVFDSPRYTTRREIRQDMRDVRQARKDVLEDHQALQKNQAELLRDRTELRNDIRRGANKAEIRQDMREIREDRQKIEQNRRDLRQSQGKLQSAHQELKDDLRRR